MKAIQRDQNNGLIGGLTCDGGGSAASGARQDEPRQAKCPGWLLAPERPGPAFTRNRSAHRYLPVLSQNPTTA
jgi:hypothetical protein